MAAAVDVTLQMIMTGIETLAIDDALAANSKMTRDQYNVKQSLGAASSPCVVTKRVAFQVPLIAGAKTLDLTALVQAGLANVNANGLKLQGFLFTNPNANTVPAGTNTHNIIIADGAANGYLLFGDASGQDTLPPGGSIMKYAPEGLADIDGTHKTIDLTGNGVEVLNCVLIFG